MADTFHTKVTVVIKARSVGEKPRNRCQRCPRHRRGGPGGASGSGLQPCLPCTPGAGAPLTGDMKAQLCRAGAARPTGSVQRQNLATRPAGQVLHGPRARSRGRTSRRSLGPAQTVRAPLRRPEDRRPWASGPRGRWQSCTREPTSRAPRSCHHRGRAPRPTSVPRVNGCSNPFGRRAA